MQHHKYATKKTLFTLCLVVLLGGCAIAAQEMQIRWTEKYGEATTRSHVVSTLPAGQIDFWTEVKPILEKRCVACHACYDASCQFKVTAIEGIERGLSKESIYNPARLKAAAPGRLFEDAHSITEWRKLGYFPALNEHADTPEFNREASLLYRTLELKETNPLPDSPILSKDEFTLGLNRSNSCPTPAEFDQFSAEHPQWGMPYALPGLDPTEQATLKNWVESGSPYTPRVPLNPIFTASINEWEAFLNQDSLKGQLVSRYLYEHLYLTHLYFPEVEESTFFKLIRSTTKPGEPAKIVATRRPFEDPGVDRVYYRIVPDLETTVAKTHNPYKLDASRRVRWQSLFFNKPYEVTSLPGYQLPDTANPFVSFDDLPMNSRYSFMLDDAQSTIMNFIKGSVCRGQVAVNVIRDHFWVFFLDPDSDLSSVVSTLLPAAKTELAVANTVGGDTFMPISHWLKYEELDKELRRGRDEFMFQYFSQHPLNLDLVWDGYGFNPNAGLTVFRHDDSATVEQGLLGAVPQTAWLIDYTILERIHYLLVAGYDVYGTLGHQLISRLHMDFLRMEAETNFLNFLPRSARDATRRNWYRGVSEHTLEYLENPKFDQLVETGIDYKTDDPRLELMEMMRARLASNQPTKRSLNNVQSDVTRAALNRLATMTGATTQLLPEVTIIRVNGAHTEHVTLLRNNAHLNMTSIFKESKRLIPAENTVTVVNGFLGSYPNAFLNVPERDIDRFVDQVLALQTSDDYSTLLDEFGIRRTNPAFWQHSDTLMSAFKDMDPLHASVLDYNRLENR